MEIFYTMVKKTNNNQQVNYFLYSRKALDSFVSSSCQDYGRAIVATYTVDDSPALESLSQIDAIVFVGVPYFFECREGCEDCKKKYLGQLDNYQKIAKQYPKIQWRFKKGMHLKAYLFGKSRFKNTNKVIVGGRNIGKSRTTDCMICSSDPAIVTGVKTLMKSLNAFEDFDFSNPLQPFINFKNNITNKTTHG